MLLVVVLITMYVFNIKNVVVHELNYNEFISNLTNQKVSELEVTPKSKESVYILTGKLDGYEKKESFSLIVPYTDSVIEKVLEESSC